MENTNQPNESSTQNINQQYNNFYGGLQPTPNSTAVLVLGIISIPTCFCWGVVGLVCGIIALVLASKGNALYKSNPSGYTISSYNNLKAGKVCGIIGVCLSGLYLLYVIFIMAIMGAAITALPWQNMH